MNGRIVLRTVLDGEKMLFPMEKNFLNVPQIGHRLDIGDVFGPCATVTMITHSITGFSYPGEVMRREGFRSCFGINVYFGTIIDVELDDDFYHPHGPETWHDQMGWDIVSRLGEYLTWV